MVRWLLAAFFLLTSGCATTSWNYGPKQCKLLEAYETLGGAVYVMYCSGVPTKGEPNEPKGMLVRYP